LSAHLSPGPICCSLHSCSLLMLYPDLLLMKQVALNSKSKCSKKIKLNCPFWQIILDIHQLEKSWLETFGSCY
jgi:hypothetical protein